MVLLLKTIVIVCYSVPTFWESELHFVAQRTTHVFHSALDGEVATVRFLCGRNWRHCWHETKLVLLGWQKQNTGQTEYDLSRQRRVSLDNECMALFFRTCCFLPFEMCLFLFL